MSGCSINKPFILLNDIDENDSIKYSMDSKIDSIVADMLKALEDSPKKKYKLVPNDEEEVGLIGMTVKSQSALEKAAADAAAEKAAAEAAAEKAAAEKAAAEKAAADAAAEKVAAEKAVADAAAAFSAAQEELAAAEKAAKEAADKAAAEKAAAETTSSNTSVERFENTFMESSSLTWVLAIILILLILYVLNNHFKIIKLPF